MFSYVDVSHSGTRMYALGASSCTKKCRQQRMLQNRPKEKAQPSHEAAMLTQKRTRNLAAHEVYDVYGTVTSCSRRAQDLYSKNRREPKGSEACPHRLECANHRHPSSKPNSKTYQLALQDHRRKFTRTARNSTPKSEAWSSGRFCQNLKRITHHTGQCPSQSEPYYFRSYTKGKQVQLHLGSTRNMVFMPYVGRLFVTPTHARNACTNHVLRRRDSLSGNVMQHCHKSRRSKRMQVRWMNENLYARRDERETLTRRVVLVQRSISPD